MTMDTYMLDLAFVASGDLSNDMYRLAIPDPISGERCVKRCDVFAGLVYGVIYNKPSAAGAGATIRIHGTAKIYADAPIPEGVPVFATVNGGICAGPVDNGFIVGLSLEEAKNAGQIIEVLLTPGNYFKA